MADWQLKGGGNFPKAPISGHIAVRSKRDFLSTR
jgi:hypothetical protein